MDLSHEDGQPRQGKICFLRHARVCDPAPDWLRCGTWPKPCRAHGMSHGPPDDPFDRRPLAQARTIAVPLLRADAEWSAYPHLISILQPRVFGGRGT